MHTETLRFAETHPGATLKSMISYAILSARHSFTALLLATRNYAIATHERRFKNTTRSNSSGIHDFDGISRRRFNVTATTATWTRPRIRALGGKLGYVRGALDYENFRKVQLNPACRASLRDSQVYDAASDTAHHLWDTVIINNLLCQMKRADRRVVRCSEVRRRSRITWRRGTRGYLYSRFASRPATETEFLCTSRTAVVHGQHSFENQQHRIAGFVMNSASGAVKKVYAAYGRIRTRFG